MISVYLFTWSGLAVPIFTLSAAGERASLTHSASSVWETREGSIPHPYVQIKIQIVEEMVLGPTGNESQSLQGGQECLCGAMLMPTADAGPLQPPTFTEKSAAGADQSTS